MKLIQQQRTKYEANRLHICKELRWSMDDHAHFQYEMLEAYILLNAGEDGWSFLGASKAYRQWWINQWNIRDIVNIETMATLPTLRERINFYEYIHSADYLIRTYKGRRILEESEATAIGRVIDERKNQQLHEQ